MCPWGVSQVSLSLTLGKPRTGNENNIKLVKQEEGCLSRLQEFLRDIKSEVPSILRYSLNPTGPVLVASV